MRQNVWWMVPSFVVAVVLGLALGYPVAWLAYTTFNVIGVWLYGDRHGSSRQRVQTWLKALAIAMLPVGVVGVLGSGGSGLTASQKAMFGSGDPDTTREAARAASKSIPSGTGSAH